MNNQIEIYQPDDGASHIDVRFQEDTVWLNRQQLAELFDRDVKTIGKHVNNVFREGELEKAAVVANFATTAADGKTYQTDHYNLDVIISVGYRVKSSQGVKFRQWATRTLRQHLVEGYTLNQQRLMQRGIEMEQALSLLSSTLQNQQMISESGEAVLAVISDYARSWSLLQAYDEQSLSELAAKQADMQPLVFETVLAAVSELKQELMTKGEATALFGQLRGDGLASAIATIEQGFGDELFYPNVASRAANLLYLVIKNHPLADGNKRTGSFLFLWYLRIHQHLLAKPVEKLINDNTLVALALLMAESKPDQKELMIRLVEHFILLKDSG
ncbi:MAG TPA: hypothetical protein DCL50_06765 [Methylococcaceae bacterium]|nr:hypothetical protein [Methylococcaceae bacterium]